MLESLKNLFANDNINKGEDKKNIDINILVGLMIEAANTDGEITEVELNKISSSLIQVFKEDPKIVDECLSKAVEDKDNSRSLYFYTSKLNKTFSDEKKIMLIEVLWEVILSDNEIHDFESNLIRRLAGLLYISDVDCGNARKRANERVKLL